MRRFVKLTLVSSAIFAGLSFVHNAMAEISCSIRCSNSSSWTAGDTDCTHFSTPYGYVGHASSGSGVRIEYPNSTIGIYDAVGDGLCDNGGSTGTNYEVSDCSNFEFAVTGALYLCAGGLASS